MYHLISLCTMSTFISFCHVSHISISLYITLSHVCILRIYIFPFMQYMIYCETWQHVMASNSKPVPAKCQCRPASSTIRSNRICSSVYLQYSLKVNTFFLFTFTYNLHGVPLSQGTTRTHNWVVLFHSRRCLGFAPCPCLPQVPQRLRGSCVLDACCIMRGPGGSWYF